MENPTTEQDPRIYFAAERTFLAWIRTGLGLMGVGFAVARFGLFLREMSASAAPVMPHTTGLVAFRLRSPLDHSLTDFQKNSNS